MCQLIYRRKTFTPSCHKDSSVDFIQNVIKNINQFLTKISANKFFIIKIIVILVYNFLLRVYE